MAEDSRDGRQGVWIDRTVTVLAVVTWTLFTGGNVFGDRIIEWADRHAGSIGFALTLAAFGCAFSALLLGVSSIAYRGRVGLPTLSIIGLWSWFWISSIVESAW